MTYEDIVYVQNILADGLIQSPCLELGVGYQMPGNATEGGLDESYTSKGMITGAGLAYVGTDMVSGPFVDYVVDFEEDPAEIRQKLPQAGQFGSALVLNVLEHTFDPIRILDNVFSVLRAGGTCVVVTPAVWPLHGYPYDFHRPSPDFYEEYCRRRSLQLLADYFEFVGKGKIHGSAQGKESEHRYLYPAPGQSDRHRLASRIVHKVFNTTGRGMLFSSHIAIGAVIRKPA